MSHRRLLFAVSAIFIFFLFVLEYTITSQPTGSDQPGEVVGVQTATSPSPSASVSSSPSPSGMKNTVTPATVSAQRRSATVTKVVDGDTIKIDTGETVRYIGMDAPETADPKKPKQCFGLEASLKNSELVLGKTVSLERDVSKTDRYGRLLAYVWIGESMVNELLVRDGYAIAKAYPPDIRHQSDLQNAELFARSEKKGLWSGACPETSGS